MPAPERWNEAGTGWPARPTRKVDPGLLTRSGTVEVRVFLSDAAPEILKKLAEAGLEGVMVVQPGRLVTGRIAASKLEALARVAAVKYIAPRA
jgi:hypothetical protein